MRCRKQAGAALLLALCALIFLSALASLVVKTALQSSRTTSSFIRQLQHEALLESAVNQVILKLVNEGYGEQNESTQFDIDMSGSKVSVRVSRETDRIDLNSAPRTEIYGFLEEVTPLGERQVRSVFADLESRPGNDVAKKRFLFSAGDLPAPADEVTQDCLSEWTTVQTQVPTSPTTTTKTPFPFSPPGQRTPRSSVLSDSGSSVAGRIVRLDAYDKQSQWGMQVIVRLTGDRKGFVWKLVSKPMQKTRSCGRV